MTETDVLPEVTESFRPSLRRLTLDAEEMSTELFNGFESRRKLVEWLQRVSIRTLGELPNEFYLEFRPALLSSINPDVDTHYDLDILLTDSSDHRTRDIDENHATHFREMLWVRYCHPAYHRAARKRRKRAGEYIDRESQTKSGHDPAIQRHISMLASLDELDTYQQRALSWCLNGLGDRSAILDWIPEVEQASHFQMDDGFARRCYEEPETVAMLTGDHAVFEAMRYLFAIQYLLPQFNAGNEHLAGKATERPASERTDTEVDYL